MRKKAKKKKEFILRDMIKIQLENAGYIVEEDSFSDKSASWLVVSTSPKVDLDAKKETKEKLIHISFNYKGTVMSNIQYTEEDFKIVSKGQRVIFP